MYKLVPREVGFEPQLCVYHFHKSGIHIFVGGSSCVTVSFKMELDCIAPREYHEKTGRLVRKDKFRTEEEKQEQKKLTKYLQLLLYFDQKIYQYNQLTCLQNISLKPADVPSKYINKTS